MSEFYNGQQSSTETGVDDQQPITTVPLEKMKSSTSVASSSAQSTGYSLRGGAELYNNLNKLNRDIAGLKKHGSPQLLDIQTFAERTWKVNLEYENYLARLTRERERLNRLVESIWHNFDTVILPLWRVDDALVPIYEQLASTRKQLESLQTLQDVNSNERAEFLLQMQSALHEVENRNVIDGKIVPPGPLRDAVPMKIPSGQAIVMNLLQKCYRLIRVLNETENVVVSPSLYPMENRLDTIIFDLESLLAAYKNKEFVDPLELRMIQEHLLSIDRMQKDGRFENADGSIPEGQAIVREKLETAFDLVHECLLNQPSTKIESTEADASGDSDTLLTSISNTVSETRDTLLSYATSISSVPISTIQSLYSSLKAGTSYIRPSKPDAAKSESGPGTPQRSRMVATLRSGLNTSGKLFQSLEGVDEKLAPSVVRLTAIRTKLKRIKNDRVAYRIRKMTDRDSLTQPEIVLDGKGKEDLAKVDNKVEASPTAETKQFRRELEELQTELDAIDAKRVDGKFVDEEKKVVVKGQAYVQSLLDECFCLVFELLDFDDESEW